MTNNVTLGLEITRSYKDTGDLEKAQESIKTTQASIDKRGELIDELRGIEDRIAALGEKP